MRLRFATKILPNYLRTAVRAVASVPYRREYAVNSVNILEVFSIMSVVGNTTCYLSPGNLVTNWCSFYPQPFLRFPMTSHFHLLLYYTSHLSSSPVSLSLSLCTTDPIWNIKTKTKLNSVALVRRRTIPTERQPHVGEVSANLCG
jgi:hypothetical protein